MPRTPRRPPLSARKHTQPAEPQKGPAGTQNETGTRPGVRQKLRAVAHFARILRGAVPQATRRYLRERWEGLELRCRFNDHAWLDAPARDKNGDFDLSKQPLHSRCSRLRCQAIRGPLEVTEVANWIEIADMQVLAKKKCPACHGRGYSKMVALDPAEGEPEGTLAKLPCSCLRIYPRFVVRPKFPKRYPKVESKVSA